MQLRRLMTCGFLLAASFLVLSTSAVQAQEASETYLFYYEDEIPNQLDIMLLQNNICLEAVLKLNPGLDINDISYGDAFYIPVNQPCYQYNEDVYGYWNFSDGYPPRLKYYENGEWLAQPYYSTQVFYRNPESIEELTHQYNICSDVLLADNVLLQDFEAYKEYAWISMDIFLPEDPPACDPNWTPSQTIASASTLRLDLPINTVTPQYFVRQYNICPEEIPELAGAYYFYQSSLPTTSITLTIPKDARPCYNERGRRLRYYDDRGNPLKQPEYSDLPIYLAAPGETMKSVATLMGVCLIDLLRVNHFPDLPANVTVELFMPPSRPCGDEPVEVRLMDHSLNDLDSLSKEFNICTERLRSLNPQLVKADENDYVQSRLYQTNLVQHWVLLPTNAPACFWEFHPEENQSIYEIERQLNVCYQEFRWTWFLDSSPSIPGNHMSLFIPNEVLPCYNQQGQRLLYPTDASQKLEAQTQFTDLQYSDMPIHIFQRADTVYSVSREYNVCVDELLAVNPMLIGTMPTGYPTFIPQTRPCYDQSTGMPLIYEDEQGALLPQPKVAEQLMYYGGQAILRLSSYYNVCANRIEDANRSKLDRQSSYLGWIIPTDRPPCYDQDGDPIDYVCYIRPVDFTVDHSGSGLSFDYEGTYCYDLAQPETEVWYQGKPYKIVPYYINTMLDNRAFTAWCYGVSLDDINTINDNPDMLEILPYQTRAIPKPTRECYIDHPQVLAGQHRYLVQEGDTLLGIAQRYNLSPQWIADANDLGENGMIWARQLLIIPSGPTRTDLYVWLIGINAAFVAGVGLIYGWLRFRHRRLERNVSTTL